MKAIISFFLILLSTLLLFPSCNKENFSQNNLTEDELIFYPNVPSQLWIYFKKFEDEAFNRGFEIDLVAANITAELIEISENGVAGSCTYGSHNPGHIEIDLTFFNQSSEPWKEMVIFHELGHCFLHRGHREDIYTDGTCVSIMRSGLGECQDNYQVATRKAYIDELFEFQQ